MEKRRDRQEKVTRRRGPLRRLAALALAAALALGAAACGQMGGGWPSVGDITVSTTAAPTGAEGTGAEGAGQGAGFSMRFLDVGQALSVLVSCDGVHMLYDGGNVDDSSLVVAYLQAQGVEELEYVFCSHAHEDHVGGLAGALARFPVRHVYAPVTGAETECFKDFVKYTEKQGLAVEVPAVGASWQLGSATVRLLGPIKNYDDTNNTSLVLRIDYGDTSFLLTGDMELEAEDDLVESGADLDVDVLQVGHHGSETSSGYFFLSAVLPETGIIPVGAGNSYGHPHEGVLSRLRDAGADVYRTDLLGAVTVRSDGQSYTVSGERAAEERELNPTVTEGPSQNTRPGGEEAAYIGNVRSRKFHSSACANLPAEKNRVLFSSYEEAVAEGYEPCGGCLP